MPLLKPSPSLSAWHNAVVHVCPTYAKAMPNGLRSPPPAELKWPTPGHAWPLRVTMAPLGISAW
jgi:hypothetical protein